MAIITGYIDFPAQPKNRRFTFRVNNRSDASMCIKRLKAKGCFIRAAWYFDKRKSVARERIMF